MDLTELLQTLVSPVALIIYESLVLIILIILIVYIIRWRKAKRREAENHEQVEMRATLDKALANEKRG